MALAEAPVRPIIIWMLRPIGVYCVSLLAHNVRQELTARLVTQIGLYRDRLAQISVLKGSTSTLLSATARLVLCQDAGYAHQLNAKPAHQQNTHTIPMEFYLCAMIAVPCKVHTLTQQQ